MTLNTYVTAVSPFEAAREVRILPKKHRSRRLHGHIFLAKVRAKLDGEDWADFPGDEPNFLRQRLQDCVRTFDYHYLNDIDAIIKIFTKVFSLYFGEQICVCSGNDPYIYRNGARIS